MRDIPKDILDRCTFTVDRKDNTTKITNITPLDPCPCGRVLDGVRRVRLAKTREPRPHYREYCHTCKLVSILDHNKWQSAYELNAKLRLQHSQESKSTK